MSWGIETRTWWLIKAIVKGAASDAWAKLRGKPTEWERQIEEQKKRDAEREDTD